MGTATRSWRPCHCRAPPCTFAVYAAVCGSPQSGPSDAFSRGLMHHHPLRCGSSFGTLSHWGCFVPLKEYTDPAGWGGGAANSSLPDVLGVCSSDEAWCNLTGQRLHREGDSPGWMQWHLSDKRRRAARWLLSGHNLTTPTHSAP